MSENMYDPWDMADRHEIRQKFAQRDDALGQTGKLAISQPAPNYMLSFHKDGKQVGTFDFNEGRMHFEGDLSESGQIFVDWVLEAFKRRIEDAAAAEREACAELAERHAIDREDEYVCDKIAAAIRARGEKK